MTERVPARTIRETVERHEESSWAVRTLASERHPNRNEDAALLDEDRHVAAVFDGMGGHAYGEDAAREAAGAVRRGLLAWEDITDEDAGDEQMLRASVTELLRSAHRRVVDLGDELYQERYLKTPEPERSKDYRAPETTAVIALVHRFKDGRRIVAVAHAGDSRAWVFRTDGTLEQLMPDHDCLGSADYRQVFEEKFGVDLTDAAVAEYRRQLDEADGEKQMSDELGRSLFRLRNAVTSSLGNRHRAPVIETTVAEVRPGDVLLLTSDGVHDNLKSSRMRELASQATNPEDLVAWLVGEAYAAAAQAPQKSAEGEPLPRAKRDDITALARRID